MTAEFMIIAALGTGLVFGWMIAMLYKLLKNTFVVVARKN